MDRKQDTSNMIKLLLEIGVSREFIASKLGSSISAVRLWEKGERNPSYGTFKLLKQIYKYNKRKEIK